MSYICRHCGHHLLSQHRKGNVVATIVFLGVDLVDDDDDDDDDDVIMMMMMKWTIYIAPKKKHLEGALQTFYACGKDLTIMDMSLIVFERFQRCQLSNTNLHAVQSRGFGSQKCAIAELGVG